MDLFPIFLKLAGRPCLIVGGGDVALRRAVSLSRAGARVTVVAPRVRPRLLRLPGVKVLRRRFRASDVEPGRRRPVLVLAATDSPGVNRAVERSCRIKGILVNRADDRDRSDFHVPAVWRRGTVSMAVSTSGGSPALAKLLARRAGGTIGPEVGGISRRLARARGSLLRLSLAKRRKVIRGVFRKAGWVK